MHGGILAAGMDSLLPPWFIFFLRQTTESMSSSPIIVRKCDATGSDPSIQVMPNAGSGIPASCCRRPIAT
jgi:hypothetical protein